MSEIEEKTVVQILAQQDKTAPQMVDEAIIAVQKLAAEDPHSEDYKEQNAYLWKYAEIGSDLFNDASPNEQEDIALHWISHLGGFIRGDHSKRRDVSHITKEEGIRFGRSLHKVKNDDVVDIALIKLLDYQRLSRNIALGFVGEIYAEGFDGRDTQIKYLHADKQGHLDRIELESCLERYQNKYELNADDLAKKDRNIGQAVHVLCTYDIAEQENHIRRSHTIMQLVEENKERFAKIPADEFLDFVDKFRIVLNG